MRRAPYPSPAWCQRYPTPFPRREPSGCDTDVWPDQELRPAFDEQLRFALQYLPLEAGLTG